MVTTHTHRYIHRHTHRDLDILTTAALRATVVKKNNSIEAPGVITHRLQPRTDWNASKANLDYPNSKTEIIFQSNYGYYNHFLFKEFFILATFCLLSLTL